MKAASSYRGVARRQCTMLKTCSPPETISSYRSSTPRLPTRYDGRATGSNAALDALSVASASSPSRSWTLFAFDTAFPISNAQTHCELTPSAGAHANLPRASSLTFLVTSKPVSLMKTIPASPASPTTNLARSSTRQPEPAISMLHAPRPAGSSACLSVPRMASESASCASTARAMRRFSLPNYRRIGRASRRTSTPKPNEIPDERDLLSLRLHYSDSQPAGKLLRTSSTPAVRENNCEPTPPQVVFLRAHPRSPSFDSSREGSCGPAGDSCRAQTRHRIHHGFRRSRRRHRHLQSRNDRHCTRRAHHRFNASGYAL